MDINGIARMAGVSRATVSRYLNNGYVSAEKRELIREAIEKTGYVPSQQAQTLRTGKTHLVGVMIPKINSMSVSRMVEGITQTLGESNYQVLLANTNNNVQTEVAYLNLFAERNSVDGVMLIGTIFTPAHEKAMAQIKVPLVVLGQEVSGYSCVYHDDVHASYEATKRALVHSKRPAYIGVTEDDIAAGRRRHQGFCTACEEAGIEVPKYAQLVADFDADSGYMACEKLLDSYPEVDAIICATDPIAFGALTCLREYGHAIPDEVQVTGIGDNSLSRLIYPSLSTVHFHYKTSGIEAAKMLLGAVEKGDSIRREVKMSYEMVRRSSTR